MAKDFDNILNDFNGSIREPINSLTDYDRETLLEIYDEMKNKSLKEKGAKEEKAEKRRKKVKKSWFRRFISIFIIFSMVTTGVVIYDFQNNGFLKRKKDLYDANKYMSTKIESYLDEAGIDYKRDSDKIIIIDQDKEKIIKIYDVMEEDDFLESEVNYALYKNCDFNSLDKILQTKGYTDFNEYLYDNYVTYDGSVRKGSENVFENMVEEGYVNNINMIKDGSIKHGK